MTEGPSTMPLFVSLQSFLNCEYGIRSVREAGTLQIYTKLLLIDSRTVRIGTVAILMYEG